MSDENLYQAPEAELVSVEPESLPYYTISIKKMIILSVATLNIFSLYWNYKHWQQQRLSAGVDCLPVLRAIFQIFFIYQLFSSIRGEAESDKIDVSWGAGFLATLYIVFSIASNLSVQLFGDPNSVTIFNFIELALSLALIIPLVMVQRTANAVNDDPQGNENNNLTWINWIFILLGISIWVLSVIGLFYVEPV